MSKWQPNAPGIIRRDYGHGSHGGDPRSRSPYKGHNQRNEPHYRTQEPREYRKPASSEIEGKIMKDDSIKAKAAVAFLTTFGVPKDVLLDLPKDLLKQFEFRFCRLCDFSCDSKIMTKTHYLSKAHRNKTRTWLVEWSKENCDTGVMLNGDQVRSFQARDVYCELCDVLITSEVLFEAHYSGSKHRNTVLKHKEPKNAKLLLPENAKRLKQLIDREITFLNMDAAEEPVKTVPVAGPKLGPIQPELWCNICQVLTITKAQLVSHMNGKKHLAKEKAHILRVTRGEDEPTNLIKEDFARMLHDNGTINADAKTRVKGNCDIAVNYFASQNGNSEVETEADQVNKEPSQDVENLMQEEKSKVTGTAESTDVFEDKIVPKTTEIHNENTDIPDKHDENTDVPDKHDENTDVPEKHDENTDVPEKYDENTDVPHKHDKNLELPDEDNENTALPHQSDENSVPLHLNDKHTVILSKHDENKVCDEITTSPKENAAVTENANQIKGDDVTEKNASTKDGDKERPFLPRDVYCELCNVVIASKSAFKHHYSSHRHMSTVLTRNRPRNLQLLKTENRSRLIQLQKRELELLGYGCAGKKTEITPPKSKAEPNSNLIEPVPGELNILFCTICQIKTMGNHMLNHLAGKRHHTSLRLRLEKEQEKQLINTTKAEEEVAGAPPAKKQCVQSLSLEDITEDINSDEDPVEDYSADLERVSEVSDEDYFERLCEDIDSTITLQMANHFEQKKDPGVPFEGDPVKVTPPALSIQPPVESTPDTNTTIGKETLTLPAPSIQQQPIKSKADTHTTKDKVTLTLPAPSIQRQPIESKADTHTTREKLKVLPPPTNTLSQKLLNFVSRPLSTTPIILPSNILTQPLPIFTTPLLPNFPTPLRPDFPTPLLPDFPTPLRPDFPKPLLPDFPTPLRPDFSTPLLPDFSTPLLPDFSRPPPNFPKQLPPSNRKSEPSYIPQTPMQGISKAKTSRDVPRASRRHGKLPRYEYRYSSDSDTD